MKKGKVKFFNQSKGFGVIKEESTGIEFFVLVSGLIDQIKENDVVTFEVQQSKKGLIAVKVQTL